MSIIPVGVNLQDELGSGANKTVYGVIKKSQGPFSIEKNVDDDDNFLKNYAIAVVMIGQHNRASKADDIKKELKLQIELAESNISIEVIQIFCNYNNNMFNPNSMFRPKNRLVTVGPNYIEDIDDLPTDNLKSISILMKKCITISIWEKPLQDIIIQFDNLLSLLVEKNKLLMDVKPGNFCFYGDNLIALDLDTNFIIDLDNVGEDNKEKENEQAKQIMFLIFCVISAAILKDNSISNITTKNKVAKFIENGFTKYFGFQILDNDRVKSNVDIIRNLINYYNNSGYGYDPLYMIRFYSYTQNGILAKPVDITNGIIPLNDTECNNILNAVRKLVLKRIRPETESNIIKSKGTGQRAKGKGQRAKGKSQGKITAKSQGKSPGKSLFGKFRATLKAISSAAISSATRKRKPSPNSSTAGISKEISKRQNKTSI